MTIDELKKKKIGFISLGCDKNRVDLENIIFKFTGERKPLFIVSEDEPDLIQVITPLKPMH